MLYVNQVIICSQYFFSHISTLFLFFLSLMSCFGGIFSTFVNSNFINCSSLLFFPSRQVLFSIFVWFLSLCLHFLSFILRSIQKALYNCCLPLKYGTLTFFGAGNLSLPDLKGQVFIRLIVVVVVVIFRTRMISPCCSPFEIVHFSEKITVTEFIYS